MEVEKLELGRSNLPHQPIRQPMSLQQDMPVLWCSQTSTSPVAGQNAIKCRLMYSSASTQLTSDELP
jgi:hypothetical protein